MNATPKTKVKLKREDTVQVIAGKEVGRTGKILKIDREKNRVIVEGLNLQTKHQKPSRANQSGGITRVEAPLHLSNVMYLHKGKPTRLGYKVTEEFNEVEGKQKRIVTKKRFAKTTGEIID